MNPWIQLDLKPASFLDILNRNQCIPFVFLLKSVMVCNHRVLSHIRKNKCLLPFFFFLAFFFPYNTHTGSLCISLNYISAKKLSLLTLKRVKGLSCHLGVAKQCTEIEKMGLGGWGATP